MQVGIITYLITEDTGHTDTDQDRQIIFKEPEERIL